MWLAGATALAVGLAGAAHYGLPLAYARPLTVVMLLLFLVLAASLFWLGKITAGSDNKFLFGNAFMAVTVVKLFLAGGIIAVYALRSDPPNKYFVIPFFTSYVVYSVLEVICLSRLAGEVKAEDG